MPTASLAYPPVKTEEPLSSGIRPIGAAQARTRLTKGEVMIPGVDGRTLWARRLKELVAIYASDLGGAPQMCEAEKSIVRRAATISIELERLEQRFALADEGGTARDLDIYSRLANTLRRLLERVGLQRRPTDVLTLDAYLVGATPTIGPKT